MMKEYDWLVVTLKNEKGKRVVASVHGYPTRAKAEADRSRLISLYGAGNVDEPRKAI